MRDKRQVRLGSASREVTTLGEAMFDLEGQRWTASADAPGAWRLTSPTASGRAFVAGSPDAPWVFFEGRVYRPEVIEGDRTPRARRDDASALSAPMPATVRSVLVATGDHVVAGQPLIVLEAMKMELPLRAPAAGTVQRLHCAAGDLVQPGTPLVEIA
jgi:acetyl/propionyl-CoA carboxylase alpha subunit